MRNGMIVSIQSGRVRSLGHDGAESPHDQPWQTAFFKQPVAGPVTISASGIDGDEVADRKNHGGPDKAILCYSADHTAAWRSELPDLDFSPGAFGENLTITGLDETTVCIGDVWVAEGVRFEVSQPRQPCWKLGRRHRQADLPKRVVKNGRSGWYVRVLSDGVLSPGDTISLESRPHSEWTVSRTASLFYDKHARRDEVAAIVEVDQLASEWRESFESRLRDLDSSA